MDQIRVMIVEDSPTVREFLCESIGSDPRLTVVAACESGEQALAMLPRTAPDVVSMDIHLPRMSGLEATRRIMETRPLPIVIVSQSVSADDVNSAMNALRAGAVSAVEKPSCHLNSRRGIGGPHLSRARHHESGQSGPPALSTTVQQSQAHRPQACGAAPIAAASIYGGRA